jgi:hypothetical protein
MAREEGYLRRRDYREGVSGEQVGDGLRGQVAFGVDGDGLVELAHPPLEHRADVVLATVEGEAEHLAHLAPDDLLVREAGQLARSAAAADDAALLVADEERGVRRRVIVVEQLEEEPEAALLAALRDVAEALLAVLGRGPVAAVGADEQMSHLND